MMENQIQLSHVLYRVKDLHASVKKLQDAGFIVEYGTKHEKAYNAIIWFEEGVFIEIYSSSELPTIAKWLFKIIGYQSVLDRLNKWSKIENGWCEWSLESTVANLNELKSVFKEVEIPFKSQKTKRKDANGQILRWELVMPKDIEFPFLMSAYTPNPRPKNIEHPNGVSKVSTLVVGKEKLNVKLLNHLLTDVSDLKLVDGKSGLQDVILDVDTIKIKEILK